MMAFLFRRARAGILLGLLLPVVRRLVEQRALSQRNSKRAFGWNRRGHP